jgi:hypothetical protein
VLIGKVIQIDALALQRAVLVVKRMHGREDRREIGEGKRGPVNCLVLFRSLHSHTGQGHWASRWNPSSTS